MNQDNLSIQNSNNAFYLILFIVITIKVFVTHFFFLKLSILSWPDISYIPLIQAIGNFDTLASDNYISSALESPNLIFVYFIKFFSYFGLDPIFTLLSLKLMLVLFTPLVVLKFCFLFSTKIAEVLSISSKAEMLQRFLLFFGVIVLSNFFYFYKILSKLLFISGISDDNISFFMPFGWDDPMSHNFAAPSTIAFICGMFFNLIALNNIRIFSYWAFIILALTTLLHPVIGIGHYIIGFIISLSLSSPKKTILIYFKYGLVSIFLPIFLLLIFFSSENTVNAVEFIETYVFMRHPHHYQMSLVFGWGSIFWSTVIFFNFLLSLFFKLKPLIILNLCTLIFISTSVLMQFIGTELFPMQRIAELGPSRFTQYLFILCLINTVINLTYLLSKKGFMKKFYKSRLEKKLINNNILYIIFIIVFSASLYYFNNQKFDVYENKDKDLITWINKHTDKSAVFFVPAVDNNKSGHPLSFIIRVFSKRSIWVDQAYPFNHDASKIWGEKYLIYKNFHKKNNSKHFICNDLSIKVDYLILNLDSELLDLNPIFISKNWRVYSMELTSNKICNS